MCSFVTACAACHPPHSGSQMAAQLAARPLHETGMQVHASQLHAPGVVFLGDAAHAGGWLAGRGLRPLAGCGVGLESKGIRGVSC